MSLTDELAKKQELAFKINELDKNFIRRVLSNKNEGIFSLDSRMNERARTRIMDYMKENKNYEFKLNCSAKNYGIVFKKKGENL